MKLATISLKPEKNITMQPNPEKINPSQADLDLDPDGRECGSRKNWNY